MGTFGMLTTAYSGLAAARAALETTAQNVSNVNTPGYTRQRVEQASLAGVGTSSPMQAGRAGAGVQVTGIGRLGDSLIDARARDAAASSGYWDASAAALATVEVSLGEPGASGLSAVLDDFWAAWQTMGNTTGSAAAANALLANAGRLTSRIAAGYTAATDQWSAARGTAASTVDTVNRAATEVAALNDRILRTTAAGGNANELIDQRAAAITSLASLTGATTRDNSDGTVDVIVGGSTIVSKTSSRTLSLAGGPTLAGTTTAPVRLEFTDRPGVAVEVGGGSLAAQLATLAPAGGGAPGGAYAQAADAYSSLATSLATAVNTAHAAGRTSTGATGLAFFSFAAGRPPALGLTVVPTSLAGIAAAGASGGTLDGGTADAIAQIGTRSDGPGAAWATFVARIGSQASASTTQANLSGAASSAAIARQSSQSSVDLDEETTNLVVFQHAYQGAARVLTAIDEMLDTLINRTGLVGR